MAKLSLNESVNEAEKFESLFREIPAALALLRGPEFIFEMANEDYLQLVGRYDIIGKPLVVAMPEIKDQAFPEILRHVYNTGISYQAREVEVFLKRDSQQPTKLSTVYLDFTYRRIQEGENKLYGIFVFAVDVTEKVKARATIQIERQKLEAVFVNSSSSLAILKGPEALFEKANASYLNLFNGRNLVGRNILDALPELRDQKFPALISHVYQTGEPYNEIEAQAYLRRTNQSPLEKRYFDQSYTRINDANGDKYGVLIHAIDVTERVSNRKKLDESLEKFRIAIEAANLGTWDLDVRTGIMDWSERTCEIFGIPQTNTILLEAALARIHPDDQARVRTTLDQAVDPLGDGNYVIDYRIQHEDANVRWVSVRGKVTFSETSQGKVAERFSGTVLDVTDRILSERQFRLIANSMPQVVWTARADGVLDYTNERWTQYANSSDPERWLDFVHPDDVPGVIKNWSHCVATGERYEAEFRLLRHSDQSYRWFLVRAHPFRGTQKNIQRWYGTCTDIEEQRAALAARGDFLSVASHELKTPLTSLKLQTQSMRRNFAKGKSDAFSDQKILALIDNNEKQVGRLIRLVDDMLDFAKIESRKLSMNFESTDLGELVAEVYERLREQIESSGCVSRLDRKPGIFVYADRFRIEQVVINLITNALRYGKGKPLELTVESTVNTALISVVDHGIGIAPENCERIFNRFERAVSPNEVSGLGLGLFISKQIVQGHHGDIWVESEIGKGSSFYVELPLEFVHE